jgi:hypothetical protein
VCAIFQSSVKSHQKIAVQPGPHARRSLIRIVNRERDGIRRGGLIILWSMPHPLPLLLPSPSFSSCSSSSPRGSPSVPSLVPRARGHKRWQSYSWLLEQSSTHDPPQVMAPQSQHITMTVNPLDTSEHISLSLLCLSRR